MQDFIISIICTIFGSVVLGAAIMTKSEIESFIVGGLFLLSGIISFFYTKSNSHKRN